MIANTGFMAGLSLGLSIGFISGGASVMGAFWLLVYVFKVWAGRQ
jgi:hypothetical protein